MKNLTRATVLIAVIAGSASCKKDIIGDGPVITQTRNVSNFSAIDLRMNGNVYYKNDPAWKLEVTAKESIHAMLETTVVDNRLVIKYRNGKTYDEDETIRINISGPDVSRFELGSSGSIYCLNTIQPANLWVHSGGSGNISLQNVMTNTIEAESSVSGHISIKGGAANNGDLKTNGSGTIDFSTVTIKNVAAKIIGSGDITLKASGRLVATIDGSGSIYYNGSPFIVSDISGSGRLIHF